MKISDYLKDKTAHKVISSLIASNITHKIYDDSFITHWTKARGAKNNSSINCKCDLIKIKRFLRKKINGIQKKQVNRWLNQWLHHLYHLFYAWGFDYSGDDIIKRDLTCILGEIFIQEKIDKWLKNLPPKITKRKLYPYIKHNYGFWITLLRSNRRKGNNVILLYSEKVACLKNTIKKQLAILKEFTCN